MSITKLLMSNVDILLNNLIQQFCPNSSYSVEQTSLTTIKFTFDDKAYFIEEALVNRFRFANSLLNDSESLFFAIQATILGDYIKAHNID